MNDASKQAAGMADDIAQIVAMNPELTLDELNLIAQKKMEERNNSPLADFCGLSPSQMSNWMCTSFNELEGVNISRPEDLSVSPVMRYLELILDEALQQGCSFKATAKGNLPAKLVKRASQLLPGFAVAEYETVASISDFAGSNEGKFNALRYTRILAELSGIIYLKNNHFHLHKTTQKQYQSEGIGAFFLPCLRLQ